MLNEKRAGMPIAKQRPMPRIVAGTDLMAALAAEHREGEGGSAKDGRQTSAAAPAATAAAKPAAAAKGKRTAKGSAGPTRDAVADRGRRARQGSGRGRKRKRRRNRRRKSPARGRRRDSLPSQRAMNPIAAAFAMSMKKAETSGRMMKACAQAPCSLVTAVILAIAVGVAPRLTPVKPAEITAA